MSALPVLDAAQLRALASRADRATRCPVCSGLKCAGWEPLPGGFDATVLRQVGTLRDPAVEDPTLDEHHPGGTHLWSPQAPIAPRSHPCNRSDVWECAHCARVYLRYTEFGGYYNEPRIREVDPSLVLDA